MESESVLKILNSIRSVWSRPLFYFLGVVLVFCIVSSCREAAPQDVTVTFLGAWWLQPDELPTAEQEFREFTRETGIVIQRSPVPETLFSSLDPPAQLDLLHKVLQEGEPSPD